MEFEVHEEREEEMGAAEYDSVTNSSLRPKTTGPSTTTTTTGGEGSSMAARKSGAAIRYRECLKNHAFTIGGHAVDGCGEFMAAGHEGTLDALKCAACNCHRNFHRKETEGAAPLVYHHQQQQQQQQQHQSFSPYYRAFAPPPAGYLHLTPTPRPLALPSSSGGGYSREEEDVSNNPSSSGGTKKRFRTKFTAEQKEKMLGFAERLGWRIQKQDEADVEQFCNETGVKKKGLKVWMHNNKNTLLPKKP